MFLSSISVYDLPVIIPLFYLSQSVVNAASVLSNAFLLLQKASFCTIFFDKCNIKYSINFEICISWWCLYYWGGTGKVASMQCVWRDPWFPFYLLVWKLNILFLFELSTLLIISDLFEVFNFTELSGLCLIYFHIYLR